MEMSTMPDIELFESETIIGDGPLTIVHWHGMGEVAFYFDGTLAGTVDSSKFFDAFDVKS